MSCCKTIIKEGQSHPYPAKLLPCIKSLFSLKGDREMCMPPTGVLQ